MMTLRYALRACRLQPVLSFAIIGTLALVLSTAGLMWSAFDCLVLRVVPGPAPARVVSIGFRPPGSEARLGTTLSEVAAIRRQSRLLEAVGSYRGAIKPTPVGAGAVEANLIYTTYGFFESFAARPIAGRWFNRTEESDCSIVLSDSLWKTLFDRNRKAVYQSIYVTGKPCLVVGVAPATFRIPDYPHQLWMYESERDVESVSPLRDEVVVGRLKPDVEAPQLVTELNAILGNGATSARDGSGFFASVLRDQLIGPVDRTLALMAGAVIALVLAACANIISLLVARDWSRQREIAIRQSLGATRRHLFREAFAYAALVAGAGGVVGLALAWWAVGAVRALRPKSVAGLEYLGMSPGLFVVIVLTALAISFLVSVQPALRAWRVCGGLIRHGQGVAKGHLRSGLGTLVAVQAALSVVLAVAAGLFAHSLSGLLRVDTGFNPHGLTYFHFSRDRKRTLESESLALNQLIEAVRAVDGVSAAALTTWPPFIGITETTRVQVETPRGWSKLQTPIQAVSANYFDVMGIPEKQGQIFGAQTRTSDPCEVVVSETLAREVWRGSGVLESRLDLYNRDGLAIKSVPDSLRFCRVIGVVGDVRERALTEPRTPRLYFALSQRAAGSAALMVRASTMTADRAARIRAVIREHVPLGAGSSIRFGRVADQMRSTIDVQIFETWLFGIFAAIALIVLIVGVFGISWFTVVQRTKEAGIRLSLGAQPVHVVKLFVWQGVQPILLGVVVGVLAAAYASRYLTSRLVGINALDVTVFAVAPTLIVWAGAIAVTVPVLRTRRIDPKSLLQSD